MKHSSDFLVRMVEFHDKEDKNGSKILFERMKNPKLMDKTLLFYL